MARKSDLDKFLDEVEEEDLAENEKRGKRTKDDRFAGGIPVWDFELAGQMVCLYPFVNARKSEEFYDLPTAHWKPIIIINENVTQSDQYRNVDQKVVFESYEARDSAWDKLQEFLAETGFNLVGIEK